MGVEGRGGFYEGTGALRDMVPNHLFTLLTMVAMDPPNSFDAEDVRAEKAKLVKAIRPIPPGDAVRGQYTAGQEFEHPVQGYREEPGVAPDSATETYVALKLEIDTWRWAGVPSTCAPARGSPNAGPKSPSTTSLRPTTSSGRRRWTS